MRTSVWKKINPNFIELLEYIIMDNIIQNSKFIDMIVHIFVTLGYKVIFQMLMT